MIEFEIDEERSISKNTMSQMITATNTARSEIIRALNQKDIETARDIHKNYLRDLPLYMVEENVKKIARLTMEYFWFELTAAGEEESELQKGLIMQAQNLPRLSRVWIHLKESLVLASSALQIELKLIINNRGRASLDDLLMLQKMLRQLTKIHSASHRYARALMTIISHLTIYRVNTLSKEEAILHLSSLLVREEEQLQKLLTLQTKIALLYNCLKTILGVRSLSQNQQRNINKMYEVFRLKTIDKYHQHLLHLFFIIKGLIARKGKALEGGQEGGEEEDEVELDRGVAEKLSIWTTVSLDETVLALEEATRNIIRHRVASLASVIGMKLSLPRFCLRFLELMNDSPFNNEAQTIKLCFELFQARDYQRLNACLEAVLSSPSCKNLREREVLLAMCSIYTGLYLNDRERSLMYAKLNHYENKKLILFEETLLQHIGFAYLNLANHELYNENREVFEGQALRALQASIKINPKNYLTQYSLGKLLLKMGDLEAAYNHGKESLMSGRGQWAPFALLACVYFCQRRFSKSVTLIDQLLKKYKGVKNLHYIRAYLEVNHLLLEVQYDQEVEAAKELGEHYYDLTQQRVLRSKSSVSLLRYCQQYYQLSLGLPLTDFDENFFIKVPALHNHEGGMMETFAVGYQETQSQQTLLQIIPLFLQAGQVHLAENLIKSLPASPSKNYQSALLHEAKGEKDKAISEYKAVISQLPYHTNSLINLSMLIEDVGDALHYLDLAQKFTWDGKLWLAKGLLLSRLGRVEEAHQLFLKQGETGWYDMLPNLLYYY